MFAVLRYDGNKEDFIELFILTYRKSLNTSELLLIILVGMSQYWEALLLFKLWIYLNFLFSEPSEIKNISTFEFILNNNNAHLLYHTNLFYLLPWSYKTVMVLLSSNKVCYQGYLFHLSLQNISFLIFSKVRRSCSFVLYIGFIFPVLFFRKLLCSLDLFIIAFERSFVINGIWLPRTSLLLSRACLFKILILVSQNLCKPWRKPLLRVRVIEIHYKLHLKSTCKTYNF